MDLRCGTDRLLMVQQSVRLLQSMHGYWARATGQRLSGDAFRHLTAKQVEQTFRDPTELFAVVQLLRDWKELQTRIHEIEDWANDDTRRRPDLIALRTTPGVGLVLGLTILLETGEAVRFHDVGEYASYCRMVPALRLSNGKKKCVGNAKCGNRYLAPARSRSNHLTT